MIHVVSERKLNPRQTSNVFSKTFFLYTLPLFKKGLKKDLENDDLYQVLPEYSTHLLTNQVEEEWKKQKHLAKTNMFKLFWNLFGKFYILLGFTKIISIILNIFRPIIIGKLVSLFVLGQTELSKTSIYLYTVLLIILNFAETIYRQNYYLQAECLAIKLRTAMCCLIYRKFLTLPVKDLKNAPFGKIETLLTRDVAAFEFGFLIFNDAWSGCITILIICYNLYWKIGLALAVVVFAFAIFAPCLVYGGMCMAKLKLATSEKTDERVNIVQKVLATIRTAKMYGWEKYVEKAIIKARKNEINILLKMFVVLFVTLVIAVLIQHLTIYFVFITCFWLGIAITAETMYFVTSAFQAMSFTLMTALPYATFVTAQAFSAIKRFQQLAEKLAINVVDINSNNKKLKPKVHLKDVTVTVNTKDVLENVNIDIDKGLSLIFGPAACGKSVFLMTLLKEFEIKSGHLDVKGRVSYASQEPWLFPSTIRKNIIFGADFNARRYQEIINVCALEYDFDLLENGDNTIISDQGINLSKGQQCRINLARALYKDSDIYLLDDCLSNLDPIVADLIFYKGIKHLLKNNIVVMVSGNCNLREYADNVITINNGNVKSEKNILPARKEDVSWEYRVNVSAINENKIDNKVVTVRSSLLDKRNQDNVYREIKKMGSVSSHVYKYYLKMGGHKVFCALIFVIFVLGQISISYKDILLNEWVNLEEKISHYEQNNTTNKSLELEELKENRTFVLYVYTFVTIAMVVMTFLRALSLFIFSKNTSVNIHKKMLHSVINATMNFFDNNFIGNIVNRFSKDLVSIDESIPFVLLHLTVVVFETIGIIFVICFVNATFLIPSALLFIALVFLKRIYLKVGRALKRLDASAKSPIVGHLNTILEGLPTIRAFQAEEMLFQEFDSHLDVYNSATYSSVSCMKAFAFVVENITSLFVTFVVLKFVFFAQDASPGDVGLAISQALMMGGIIHFGIYKWADLEIQMTSVERAVEYIYIPQEDKLGFIRDDWPKLGEIKYENVHLSFKNCKDYVLKNINFTINSGEKIGIVGRTGSGKSSLISALFRLYDFDGKITIDGVDIKTLPLDFLRSKISIISQDPIVLNGTLRDTIDPEKIFNDNEIWTAIDHVKLRHVFTSLDTEIISWKLSFGQKQLINLARILVQRNKIIVFDEITENGDAETENLIFDIICRYFSSCTLVKISHKMKFVMDCNKVLVLSNGVIAEYDRPENLLKKRGLFYKMVKI